MIYVPDNYDYQTITDKFGTFKAFVSLQIKYKKAFEEYLDELVYLREVDEKIINSGLPIPRVQDENYNFYHQSGILKSGCLYLRNNFYLERLSDKDIVYLIKESNLKKSFLERTYTEVISEHDEPCSVMFGTPLRENLVVNGSIVMEFTYNESKCQTIDQYFGIKDLKDEIFEDLKVRFQKAGIPLSLLVYGQIIDYFKK